MLAFSFVRLPEEKAAVWQVCQLEHQLFEHFFPAAAAEPEAMKPLLDPMCNILYDALRPTTITMSDMDQLCELVEIMRHEILQVPLPRQPPLQIL